MDSGLGAGIDLVGFIPGVGWVAKAGRTGRGFRSYGHAAREFVLTPKDLYNIARHPGKTTAPIFDSVVHGGKVLADPHTIPHTAISGRQGTLKGKVRDIGVDDPRSLDFQKHQIRPWESDSIAAKAAVDEATMRAALGKAGGAELPTGGRLTIDSVPINTIEGGALVHATPFGGIFSKDLLVQGSEKGMYFGPSGAVGLAKHTASGKTGPHKGYGVLLDPDGKTQSSGEWWHRGWEGERIVKNQDVLPKAEQYLQAHSVPDMGGQAYTVAMLGGKLSPLEIAKLKVQGITKAAHDLTPWRIRSKGWHIDEGAAARRIDDSLDPLGRPLGPEGKPQGPDGTAARLDDSLDPDGRPLGPDGRRDGRRRRFDDGEVHGSGREVHFYSQLADRTEAGRAERAVREGRDPERLGEYAPERPREVNLDEILREAAAREDVPVDEVPREPQPPVDEVPREPQPPVDEVPKEPQPPVDEVPREPQFPRSPRLMKFQRSLSRPLMKFPGNPSPRLMKFQRSLSRPLMKFPGNPSPRLMKFPGNPSPPLMKFPGNPSPPLTKFPRSRSRL